MEFEELKEKVEKFVIEHREYLERGLEEVRRAKICYDDGFDLIGYLNELKEKGDLSSGYVIPYVLGMTDKIDLGAPVEVRQAFAGSSNGLDVDCDISTSGKPRVKKYLEEKYGKDHVLSVGTYMELGLASSIKDILRKENVPFKESNEFCSELNNELSFEENMKVYEKSFPNLYKTYQKFKVKLDLVPQLGKVIRSCSKHAGGVLILDKPVYECLPVIRPQGELASAFVENGGNTELDELGYVKYDLLGISTLDIISDSVDMINEELYRIIDDDGIEKIVPESYLHKES